MKRTILITLLALFSAGARASAVVIYDTNVSLIPATVPDPSHPGNQVPGYWMNVIQNLSGDGTGVAFAYTGRSLQSAQYVLDEGSDWYLVPEGAFFSASTIAAGDFTPIFVDTALPADPVVKIPLGDFYLGVNTGTGFSTDYRSVFGWVALHNDGTALTPLGNAVAYGESGIVVGAPEPCCGVLLMTGASFLAVRRDGRSARR